MSRAFVKEPEGDQPDDALPDRPLGAIEIEVLSIRYPAA